jgi:hypothetical protein
VGASSPARKSANIVITGVKALSIWMKLTLRYRYTRLPAHSVAAMKKPTGMMRRNQ